MLAIDPPWGSTRWAQVREPAGLLVRQKGVVATDGLTDEEASMHLMRFGAAWIECVVRFPDT